MTLAELEEFKKQVSVETQITPDNVQEMSLKILNVRMRYLDLYISEKRKLSSYELEMTKKYNDLYKHYRFKGDYKLETKQEVESFVKTDDDYHKMRIRYEAQSLVVEYLQSVCSSIEKYGFFIKSFIDMTMLKTGNIPK